MGLYCLSCAKDLIDLELTAGRDYTWISRVLDVFVLRIQEKHSWRIFDNLEYWTPRFPRYAASIRKKPMSSPGW